MKAPRKRAIYRARTGRELKRSGIYFDCEFQSSVKLSPSPVKIPTIKPEDVKWFDASENDDGIDTIAMIDINDKLHTGRIVGYNGILKGDTVKFEGRPYTVVMVSRLGHIGLSETGALPYTKTVRPSQLTKEVT